MFESYCLVFIYYMETEYYELSICDNDLKYNNQYQLQQQTTHYFTLVYTTCVNSTTSTKLKYILC